MDEEFQGNLIVIGGAEDKYGTRDILMSLCSKIDKEKDELVVITTATQIPEEIGPMYKEIFGDMGVKNISILNIQKREEAYEVSNINMAKRASILYFSGGDQLRLTSLLGGTPIFDTIKDKFKDGCIFAGTSAGASVMSDTMVVTGPNDESPRKCTLKMAAGFGFVKGTIIDQHFAQRGRLGRLLTGIAENPENIGIGIDENTAIVVNQKNEFKVIGAGAVYVIDGRNISDNNVSEQYPDEVLSIFDVKLHVLKNGDKFSLAKRRPLRNSEKKIHISQEK